MKININTTQHQSATAEQLDTMEHAYLGNVVRHDDSDASRGCFASDDVNLHGAEIDVEGGIYSDLKESVEDGFNCHVNATAEWIRFADPLVKQILVEQVGADKDGDGGISVAEAESLTSFNGKFGFGADSGVTATTERAAIVTFDECCMFKNVIIGSGPNRFDCCIHLKSINLSWMKFGKDAHRLFYLCSSLKKVVLDDIYTSACTNMQNMFQGCSSLTSLDVSGFDTAACTNMQNMFQGCSSLTSLDVSGFDTAACTNMINMFHGCSSLTSLDVSGFNTSACTNLGNMFHGCSSLTSLDVSNFNTSACPKINDMFDGCKNLLSLNIENIDTIKLTVNNASLGSCGFGSVFFRGLTKLTSLKISSSFFNCASRESDPHTNFKFFNTLTAWTNATEVTNLLNCLPDLTGFTDGRAGTLKLSTNTYNVTTEEQRAAALAKGWTISK